MIVGSTRQSRFSEKPARWIFQQLQRRDGIEAQLLDLRDFPMPFFDDPVPPASPGRAPYEHEMVQQWTAKIAASDGFVFVTPKYNYGQTTRVEKCVGLGISRVEPQGGGLRQLWQRHGRPQRPAAPDGGDRASNGPGSLIRPYSRCEPFGRTSKAGTWTKDLPTLGPAKVVIDDLLWWTAALKTARASSSQSVAAILVIWR